MDLPGGHPISPMSPTSPPIKSTLSATSFNSVSLLTQWMSLSPRMLFLLSSELVYRARESVGKSQDIVGILLNSGIHRSFSALASLQRTHPVLKQRSYLQSGMWRLYSKLDQELFEKGPDLRLGMHWNAISAIPALNFKKAKYTPTDSIGVFPSTNLKAG